MDLNILISTTVTSTAALIAIIGGFLVSRIITLSSEQSSIKRRLKEVQLSIQTKQSILKEVEENLLEEDRENFVTENYVELVFDQLSVEDLLKSQGQESAYERTAEELSPAIEELSQVNKELEEIFDSRGFRYSDDLPSEFSDFLNGYNVKLQHRLDWYELLYDEHQIRMDKRPSPIPGMLDASSYGRLAITHPSDRISSTMRTQETIKVYLQKWRDRNTYKNDVDHLKRQEAEYREILKDYGKPRGMWGGLIVLIYASVVGIAYPITLLPYPLQTYNDGMTKSLILTLFFSLLLVLFIYLAINMKQLTKNIKDEDV